ncbi:MAG: cytochrome b [Methylomonas sp.]
MEKHSNRGYTPLQIGLHWLMFVLLVAVYACIELKGLFPKGSDPREALKVWHSMLGLCVILLVLPRLFLRLSGTTPAIEPETAAWQQSAARLLHLALYGVMFSMPLLGWLLLSAAGKPIPFFGLQLPALVGENKDLAKLIKEVHETLGVVGYYLIGLHIAAGLYHHYILHDDALIRLLPSSKSGQEST